MTTWFDEILSVLEQDGVTRDTIYAVAQVYLRQREAANKDGNEAFTRWTSKPGATNIKSAFLAGYRAKNL